MEEAAATEDKVRVEYIANEENTENIVHIVDFGNNFSTAIVASSEPNGAVIDERSGIITVISEGQIQDTAGTTYEYIPLNPCDNAGNTSGARDALQAALESAEVDVDKMELLRTADGTIIYENSDSNPQSQAQVCFLMNIGL